MGRPVSTLQPAFFSLPCSVCAIGPWVGAGTREEFTIVQTEAVGYAGGSAEGLHGSMHGPSYQWNTAQTEAASLGKYNLFHRLDFERSKHKYLRTGDSSRHGSEIMEVASIQ